MTTAELEALASRYSVPDSPVLTPKQIADLPLFGGAKSAVYQALSSGSLPSIAIPPGSSRPRYKVARADLLEWLARCVRQ